MEIKVTIDGREAPPVEQELGPVPTPAAVTAQPAGKGAAPPPEVAAAAAAIGAIDAGPAHIPPGQVGQPLANVVASAPAQAADAGLEPALAAGAAPEYAQEVAEVIEAEGEAEA